MEGGTKKGKRRKENRKREIKTGKVEEKKEGMKLD